MSRSRTIGDVFSPRMRRFVLVLLFLSAGAVVATLLYGARLVTPSPGEADSYGGGPLGHREADSRRRQQDERCPHVI